jgi:hypothetical protein
MRVIYTSRLLNLWSLKVLGDILLLLLSRNHFQCPGTRELDLWPSDPIFSRGYLDIRTNIPIKFSNYWAKTIFNVNVPVTLTFDRGIQNSVGVISISGPIYLYKFRFIGKTNLLLLSTNHFQCPGPCDLWPHIT